MTRYRLTIEYDGSPFVGWQMQANGPSVQAAIEIAVEACAEQRVLVHGAGRTDAGVHALGQVAHVDLNWRWDANRLREALNHHLKQHPIAILEVEAVSEDFHARFSAIGRRYLYRIINRRPPLAIERARAWRVAVPLDADAMHEAAQVLVGKHDFTTFRASYCQAKSPVKTLDSLNVERAGDVIEIRAGSRSFLHHQVRSMAGTLKLVGEGKWTKKRLSEALEARDRKACGPVAPAEGLYLTNVVYE